MENYLKQVTPEMVQAVDELRRRNFAEATPEEIEMYAQVTRIQALHDSEVQAHRELMKQESDERRACFKAQADAAMDALTALADEARAKLEVIENG